MQILGYWYYKGLVVEKNCAKAAYYYGEVAKSVAEYSKTGPPGGQTSNPEKINYPDKQGG